MKTWTCNNFKGHNPVGVGAVIQAPDLHTAILTLEFELIKQGLTQQIQPEQMILISSDVTHAVILTDGEY